MCCVHAGIIPFKCEVNDEDFKSIDFWNIWREMTTVKIIEIWEQSKLDFM